MQSILGIRGTSAAVFAAVLAAVLACFLAATPTAEAATIQTITDFGSNPSGIGMYLFTPTNVAAKPAILVGVHACHGKGTDVCTNGGAFAQQAEKYGFLLICPSAVSSDGCWDVHSAAELMHNGGDDASGIISMVNYVVQNKNGDASRVYAAGHSSGGMMTNILLGSYPDVFKAGSAFAGVAFGCFASGSVDSLGWNSGCANGNVTKTGAQWGDLVRAAYPGFMGRRPRMQLWHGTTDAIVLFRNFAEEIKQWTNVHGVSEMPTTTENNIPRSTWIRTRYADSAGVVQVEAIQETGQPHNLVVDAAEAIKFFGLDGSSPPPVVDGGAGDAALDGGGAGGGAGTTGAGGGSGAGGRAAGSGGVAGAGNTGGASQTGGDPLAPAAATWVRVREAAPTPAAPPSARAARARVRGARAPVARAPVARPWRTGEPSLRRTTEREAGAPARTPAEVRRRSRRSACCWPLVFS
ncbi:MAG: PHB depolymerase family esterase [Pseudomonadota bacterium]